MAILTSDRGASNAWMSIIDPEFALLTPAVDEIFEKIWTYKDMTEFRGNWVQTRQLFASNIPLDGFTITHEQVPVDHGAEIEIRVYRPDGLICDALPLLFVLHAGGWVVGGHDSENSICRAACVRNGMAVISVDYRRAPEYQFPTALDDAHHVFHWVTQHSSQLHIDASRIILAGTSSGANLIAGLALRLRDEGSLDGVRGQILNIPALCHPDFFPSERYELNSYQQNAKSPTIDARAMRWFWDQYCPDSGSSAYASPLLAASYTGLPPTLIQVAGLDVLRDEGIAYATILERAGVPVELKTYPGLPHGFLLAVHLLSVEQYYEEIVDFIHRTLGDSERVQTNRQMSSGRFQPLQDELGSSRNT